MCTPKSIGILGGAGPLAGAFLLERILTLASTTYGCYRDADYPQVFLLSYPFSEMLSPTVDSFRLSDELRRCLNQLRSNGASVLAIACNTLHAFLDDADPCDDLVNLPCALAEMAFPDEPLILCTSTSARFGLHKRYLPCIYPDAQTQQEVDRLIDQILRGVDQEGILAAFETLMMAQTQQTIILGCTELSLYARRAVVPGKVLVDPLDVVAAKVLERTFQESRRAS